MKKLFSIMHTKILSLQGSFQKVDKDTGGKWLTHCTKHHKDNQLQSLGLPCRVSY